MYKLIDYGISSLLTSLKGKGILRRECKGAYTVVGNLFAPIDKAKE